MTSILILSIAIILLLMIPPFLAWMITINATKIERISELEKILEDLSITDDSRYWGRLLEIESDIISIVKNSNLEESVSELIRIAKLPEPERYERFLKWESGEL